PATGTEVPRFMPGATSMSCRFNFSDFPSEVAPRTAFDFGPRHGTKSVGRFPKRAVNLRIYLLRCEDEPIDIIAEPDSSARIARLKSSPCADKSKPMARRK